MNIVAMELKRRMRGMLIWSAVISGIMILFLAFFPSFKDSGMMELINAKLDAMPEGFLQAMNLNSVDFSDIVQYFTYCYQYVLMASCIYAAMLGAGALVEEESEGTISFLYAKPVSRTNIVSAKLLGILATYWAFVIITGALSMLLCVFFKPAETDTLQMLSSLKLVFVYGFTMELIYLSIGFLISIALHTLKQATPISIGIFFVTYFAGIASKLTADAEFLRWFAPVFYFEPADVAKNGYVPDTGVLIVTAALIVVPILLSYVFYNKKDLRA